MLTTRARKISLFATLLVAAACGSQDRPIASGPGGHEPAPSAPDGRAPTLRLPDDAAPRAYRASLEIDPKATSFRGHIEIDVTVKRAVDQLWLNAQDLTIEKAALRQGRREIQLTAAPQPRSFVALRGEIAAGEATLVLEYTGKQDVSLANGMGRYTDAGDWYVVTHFEPDDARRVFPCFDEPGFKVPWQLELTVPDGMMGLSNTPVEKEEKLADGRQRIQFRATRPLPSYLIAIAVGPFATVDAGKTRSGVPTRIVVPRGRAGDAGNAATEANKVLAFLEDYTGIPYDYGKLDHVVVPGTQRGAMEHPGLVTYGPRWLLIRKRESVAALRAQVGIVAHELAHQWFGNLVTTAWWDDLWLNEAFATWMAPKVIQVTHPEMDGALEPVSGRSTALMADALASARRIRQPIVVETDMRAAFDRITYSKGATVIRMFERWIGPDAFQKAVREYLKAHSDKNATGADFLAALGKVTDKPVGPAFASFLDQAGVPEIAMELDCKDGAARLKLAQKRFVPAGAARVSGDPTWQVPVCVAVPDGKGRKEHCTLLTEKQGEIALGDRCPAWVLPNVDGAGYYLARLPAEQLGALFRAGWGRLERIERLAVLSDLGIQVDGGQADVSALLALLPRLGSSNDPYLIDVAIDRLERLGRAVPADQDEPFARLVRATLGPAGKRIGWTPRAREKLAEARLRGKLMSLLAVEGKDRAARSRALALARDWMSDHASVPDSMWSPVLTTAVRADAKEIVPALIVRLSDEQDRVARRAIYQALARTSDPALYRQVLELALASDPIPPEMIQLFATPEEIDRQADLFAFVRDHADDLVRRFPEQFQGALGTAVCDPRHRDEVAGFLEQRIAPLPEVGALAVTQKVEWMDQCIARHATQSAALATALSRGGK
jgi:alanyl aminopeptidase